MSLVIMENYSGELAYDLRQRYAKIVGDHLEDVASARREQNYPEYFRSLEDLYVVVKHKFKTKKKKKNLQKKKKESKSKKETYKSLKNKVCEIANSYVNAWVGKGNNPEEIGKIEEALRKIEMFLYEEMNNANMFGSKREQDGLI